MKIQPIFKWSGEYAGFIAGSYLFSADADYLGWIDNVENVWKEDGEFMGKLVEKNYILRSETELEPLPALPVLEPAPLVPPAPCADRPAKAELDGWTDAVDWLD